MRNLKFVLLVFRLAVVQCFLTNLPVLLFGMAMYVLCIIVYWKYVSCFLILIFTEVTVVTRLQEMALSLTRDFGLLNRFKPDRLWGLLKLD